MRSPVLHGCYAIALLASFACSPRAATVPHHPNAEARNTASPEKKARKRRPLVAPPPAYGNKIVLERDRRQSGSEPDSVEL
jgi:hypothetical protein